MTRIDELRLMTKVARMYFDRKFKQNKIAHQLGLSQATVSRMIKRAEEEGIVRITVSVPNGVNTELEEKLAKKFGLKDAIVVDCVSEDNENLVQKDIGGAAAFYVMSTIKNNEIIGISSWSSTLLALVDSMHQVPGKHGIQVVQILGGIGNPSAEAHANRLTGRFASLVNGTSRFLPSPGVVGSEAAHRVILEDTYVKEAMSLFDQVTTALVGIGALEPSKLLAESGNIFSPIELDSLKTSGAVGDILLRFFDASGKVVKNSLDKRVISMSLKQLRQVDRSIGVAGGRRKYKAVLAALRGQWINILITDCYTAQRLMKNS